MLIAKGEEGTLHNLNGRVPNICWMPAPCLAGLGSSTDQPVLRRREGARRELCSHAVRFDIYGTTGLPAHWREHQLKNRKSWVSGPPVSLSCGSMGALHSSKPVSLGIKRGKWDLPFWV